MDTKNTVKVLIKDKAHYHKEWSDAVKKGFSLDDGEVKLLHFTPESIVYHLAEKVATPLQRDYINTGTGKLYYFEDAEIVSSITSVRQKRRKDPNKSEIILSRRFETIHDAIEYIKEVTGYSPKINKIYKAIKHGDRAYTFEIKFKRKSMGWKNYCDKDNLQLTLPFVHG